MWKMILGFILKHWKVVLIILLLLLCVLLVRQYNNTRSQLAREKNNVESLTTDIKIERTKNNESVATIQELQYTVEEWKKRNEEDQKLIKELKIKASQVREVVKTVVETRIEYRDTLIQVAPKEYVFNKETEWWDASGKIDLEPVPPTIDLNVSSRDSLTHILYKVPKCKFLWWEWGVKRYEIKVISHNPDSEVSYSQWINISNVKTKRDRE